MKKIIMCVDPIRKMMVPNNELGQDEFVFPVLPILKEHLQKDEHVEVSCLGKGDSELQFKDVQDDFLKSGIKAGYTNIVLDGHIADHVTGVYSYIMDTIGEDDELYIDISYVHNDYLYMTMKVAALQIYKNGKNNVIIIDKDYESINMNDTVIYTHNEMENTNLMQPMVDMCFKTGLFLINRG